MYFRIQCIWFWPSLASIGTATASRGNIHAARYRANRQRMTPASDMAAISPPMHSPLEKTNRKLAWMNSKSFSESFSKTFSKGVRTAMHLKWPSYLLLLEKQCIFSPKTGHESPDSDPRLHLITFGRMG